MLATKSILQYWQLNPIYLINPEIMQYYLHPKSNNNAGDKNPIFYIGHFIPLQLESKYITTPATKSNISYTSDDQHILLLVTKIK